MWRFVTGIFLLAIISFCFAEAPAVTTQPTNSEMEDLRAQVKSLQQENDLLRSTLAAAGKSVAPPAVGDEKPLAGIEALLQEFPANEIPGPDDGTLELRRSLLLKWIQNHAIGRTITLHARFITASGITNNAFEIQVASPPGALHPFSAHMPLPELQAPTVVDFKRDMPLQVTGQIGELTLNGSSANDFTFAITLIHPLLAPDHGQPAGPAQSPKRKHQP